MLRYLPEDARALEYAGIDLRGNPRAELQEARCRQNPTAATYLNLSAIYYMGKDYTKAVAAAEQALTIQPDSSEAYNTICASRNDLAEWGRAIEACNRALQIRPDFQLAHNNLNWAFSRKESTSP